MKRERRRGASILMEPSVEEERLAFSRHSDCQESMDNSDNTNRDRSIKSTESNVISKAKNGRCSKAKLTSLLLILFGLLALTCKLSSYGIQAQQANKTAAASKNLSMTPTASPPVVGALAELMTSNKTSLSEGNALIIEHTKMPPSNGSMAESTTASEPMNIDDINLDEGNLEDSESSSDEDNKQEGGSRRLTNLLLDTAGEAADQFVAKTRDRSDEAKSDEAEALNEEVDEGEIASPVKSQGTTPGGRILDRRQSQSLDALINNKTSTNKRNQEEEELKLAMDTYVKWRSSSDEIIELFSKKLLPIIVEHGYDVDAVTVTGLLQLFNGIRGLKPWALKLLDASAKITPGLLVGTQSDFGDFDECLNVRVDDPSGLASTFEIDETTGLKSTTIVGRYCLADVEFPKPPRVRLDTRNEELMTDFAPIELRRPLLNFSQTADFKDTIFVETANFFHMLYVDPIRVGICMTNKIDPDSLAKVLNKLFEELRVTVNFHGRCVTKYDKPVWTIQQQVSAYVVLAACGLVVISTLMEILLTKLHKISLPSSFIRSKSKLQAGLQRHQQLLTSFSILRNTRRLLKPPNAKEVPSSRQADCQRYKLNLSQSVSTVGSTPSSSSLESSPSIERRASVTGSALDLISEPSIILAATDKQQRDSFSHQAILKAKGSHPSSSSSHEPNLSCLHGIRVITMTWMIVNHTYLFGGFFVLWAHRRLIDIAEWPKSISFQLVLNGWLTVETYFFLSAAIIVLNVMPLLKARRFSYPLYILHRLLRLLPAYTGLICLNFLWPLISSGPVWLVKGKSFIQTPCENYLWTNFLFINNWIWPEKQCMVHTWFLSADFQLYLLAPIVVYLLYRRPVFGHSLNIIVTILASLLSGFVIYANKLMPSTLINKLEFDSIKQQLSYSYFATYQHMGPYCLGIFTGYLLHKTPQVHLPKYLTWLLWLILPPLSFTTLLLTYLWNGAYDDPKLINPSPLVSALYVAIHRTIWTSLLAWIVFACATGRASLMSSFLSHPIFIPMSRLSFSIYLVHLPVIMYRALNLRHTIEWTDSNILWEACGNFIVSLMAGYFVNVTFESPIINLENLISGKHSSETNKLKASADDDKQSDHSSGKGRNILQPQLTKSKSGSLSGGEMSDGDDKSSSQEATSSSERDRKLSGLNLINQPSSIDENPSAKLYPQTRWQNSAGSIRREALFPKKNPNIEQIFSLLHHSTTDPAMDDGAMVALNSSASNARRYPSHESPSDLMNNDLFCPPSLGLDYLRGGDPRTRSLQAHSRVTQYATLTRPTNRVNQEFMDRYYDLHGSLYNGTARSRSHLGDSVPQPIALNSIRQRALMNQRQRKRYNTLTGAGTKEWRGQQYNLFDDRMNWRLGQTATVVPETTDWLQPGVMIPRIDSSTLKRHPKQVVEPSTGSIVEESAFEEREEAAL